MKSTYTEIAAAWIVAVALVAAMAATALLPKTPPLLYGATTLGTARPDLNVPPNARRLPDSDLPLLEFGDPFGPTLPDATLAGPRGPGSDLTPDIPAGNGRG